MQKWLLEFYIKVQQHFSATVLYCFLNIAIMWKPPVDFEKLKMLRALVYLLKYRLHFNKNWIFVAIYVVQKLNAKTCLSKTWKWKHVSMLKMLINEITNWKSNMWKTCLYNKRMHLGYKFKVQCWKHQLVQTSYTSPYL